MSKLNLLPELTWRFTGANSVTVKLEKLNYKEYKINPNIKLTKEFNKMFENKKYGLSKEVLDFNEKLRNYEKLYVLEKNIDFKKEFILDNEYDRLNDLQGIWVKEGVEAKIILDYKCDKDVEAFRNSILKVKAEKGSKLKIIVIQRLSKISKSFFSMISEISEEASVEFINIEIGSKSAYSNYKGNLKEKLGEAIVKTAYYVDKDRYLDLCYVVTHDAIETNSDIVVSGVLKDFAVKRFAGAIDFLKGCTLSTGNEEEFVTMLDNTVKNVAVPILLAREHDIVGNHAGSSGHVDKDKLFYITSRGFDKLEAKRIIIESRVKPVLDLIDDQEIAEQILEEIREGIQ